MKTSQHVLGTQQTLLFIVRIPVIRQCVLLVSMKQDLGKGMDYHAVSPEEGSSGTAGCILAASHHSVLNLQEVQGALPAKETEGDSCWG